MSRIRTSVSCQESHSGPLSEMPFQVVQDHCERYTSAGYAAPTVFLGVFTALVLSDGSPMGECSCPPTLLFCLMLSAIKILCSFVWENAVIFVLTLFCSQLSLSQVYSSSAYLMRGCWASLASIAHNLSHPSASSFSVFTSTAQMQGAARRSSRAQHHGAAAGHSTAQQQGALHGAAAGRSQAQPGAAAGRITAQ